MQNVNTISINKSIVVHKFVNWNELDILGAESDNILLGIQIGPLCKNNGDTIPSWNRPPLRLVHLYMEHICLII